MSREWKVFIASSGQLQARRLAEAVKHKIETWDWIGGQVVRVELWYKSFEPGDVVIDRLRRMVDEADFGVFLFHPSDRTEINGRLFTQVRDNVVLEYGMFMGALGLRRAFAVLPKDDPDLRRMSDLDGLTVTHYEPEQLSGGRPDFDAAVEAAGRTICLAMERQGAREPRNLHTVLDVLNKSGITDINLHREDALDRMLADIAEVQRSVTIYARVHITELIGEDLGLPEALAKAVRATKASPNGEAELRIRQVTTPPSDDRLVATLWEIERNFKKSRWESLDDYRHHVGESWRALRGCSEILAGKPARRGSVAHRKVAFEVAPFVGFVSPYSMLLLDDSVLYVGFYLLNREAKYGRHSPAVRLKRRDDGEPCWFDSFLKEAQMMEESHVGPAERWEIEVQVE